MPTMEATVSGMAEGNKDFNVGFISSFLLSHLYIVNGKL